MNLAQLSEKLCRSALWISRMRTRFGLQLLQDSGYLRIVVLSCGRSSSLHLPLAALLSIRSSESSILAYGPSRGRRLGTAASARSVVASIKKIIHKIN